MIKQTIPIIFMMCLVGCSTTQIRNKINNAINEHAYVTEQRSPEKKNQYEILKRIPFGENSVIDERIKTECKSLGDHLSKKIVESAPKFDLEVTQITKKPTSNGIFVDVYFVNIYTRGNAFIGHRKSTAIKADLYLDNKLFSSKSIARNSNGGLFGAFKSSCSVLERTVNALGSDVAKWLATQDKVIKASS